MSLSGFSDPPSSSGSNRPSHAPPEPGEPFTVPGRRDRLTVAHLIASFTSDDPARSLYLVQTPAGSRWVLIPSEQADGPRWVGRAVPAETTELSP